MEQENNNGLMAVYISGNSIKALKKVKEDFIGWMGVIIQEAFMITNLKDKASTNGKMVEYTKESGKKIKWKVMVNFIGQMEENMKANTRKIKEMEKEHINGHLDKVMKEVGTMEECMEVAFI